MFENLLLNTLNLLVNFFSLLLPFVIIFFPIIIVHELGHLLAALSFGVKPDAFAVCFGPNLYKFKLKGIEWQLNAIPLGGYVKFAEQGKHDLEEKSYFCRLVVYLAGPVANFLFALVLFLLAFSFLQPINNFVVNDQANDDAFTAGFQEGDQILAVNDQPLGNSCLFLRSNTEELPWLTHDGNVSASSDLLRFALVRQQEPLTLLVAPEAGKQLLVSVQSQACLTYNGLSRSIPYSLKVWWHSLQATVAGYAGIIASLFSDQESDGRLVGIVGISEMSKNVVTSTNLFTVLIFMAMINFGIGFFNLLPIPILDGGQIFYMTFAKLFPVLNNKQLRMAIFGLATALILILTAYLVFKDLNSPLLPTAEQQEPELLACSADTRKNTLCFINLSTRK